MRTQLLCTFTTKDNLDKTIENIKESYKIVFLLEYNVIKSGL